MTCLENDINRIFSFIKIPFGYLSLKQMFKQMRFTDFKGQKTFLKNCSKTSLEKESQNTFTCHNLNVHK